jgi:outer membrane protein assembly factor BamA
VPLNDLIGTQMGLTSVELRFPILTPMMHFVPNGFPPIEGAVFFDMGIATNANTIVKWQRAPGDNPFLVRVPIKSFGVSARMNLFGFMILRLDWALPQDRPGMNGLWTLSIGPTW